MSTFLLLIASICIIVIKFWFTKVLPAFVKLLGVFLQGTCTDIIGYTISKTKVFAFLKTISSLVSRLSPRANENTAFPYCKQWKAGRGLGTRLNNFFMGQAATEVSLLQCETGGGFAPTRRVFRQKEKRLKTIQERFSNNEWSLDEYTSALSNWEVIRCRRL